MHKGNAQLHACRLRYQAFGHSHSSKARMAASFYAHNHVQVYAWGWGRYGNVGDGQKVDRCAADFCRLLLACRTCTHLLLQLLFASVQACNLHTLAQAPHSGSEGLSPLFSSSCLLVFCRLTAIGSGVCGVGLEAFAAQNP